MRGADFVIGYVENDGNVVIEDHTADTELGGTDDVELIAGELTNDGTMLHFRRPLDSGDEYDNPLTPGDTHTILLAYGNANDLTSDHGPDQRTSFDVEFYGDRDSRACYCHRSCGRRSHRYVLRSRRPRPAVAPPRSLPSSIGITSINGTTISGTRTPAQRCLVPALR